MRDFHLLKSLESMRGHAAGTELASPEGCQSTLAISKKKKDANQKKEKRRQLQEQCAPLPAIDFGWFCVPGNILSKSP